MSKQKINICIMGASQDVGFLGNTSFAPKHGWQLYSLVMRLVPGVVYWYVSRFIYSMLWRKNQKKVQIKSKAIASRVFDVLSSKNTYHLHENGLIPRLEKKLNRRTHITNLSVLGNSLKRCTVLADEIPANQQLFILNLGGIDFVQKTRILKIRNNLRKILTTIGEKNPNAHIVVLGIPDMVELSTNQDNNSRVIPFFFSPRVTDIHRMTGFHGRLHMTPQSTAAEKEAGLSFLAEVNQVLENEPQNLEAEGKIKSHTFINTMTLPMHNPEDRSRLFAIEGFHLTDEGSELVANHIWQQLEPELETFTPQEKESRVAIIGGGIAGLTSAYLLNDTHDITLFEKSERLGGNAYTHRTKKGKSVDLGVAAFSRAYYKNFFKILDQLKIDSVAIPSSFLSFNNLDTNEGLYITPTWEGLQEQNFMLVKKHLLDLIAVYFTLRKLRKELNAGKLAGLTMGACLDAHPRLTQNARTIFLSALCLLTSMKGEDILESPAEFFIKKLTVYRLLSLKTMFSMSVMRRRTKSYIQAMSTAFQDRVVFNADIKKVTRNPENVLVEMTDGKKHYFDKVIFACPADKVLPLLNQPTQMEEELLGNWKYEEGKIVLHSDFSSFPRTELMGLFTFLYNKDDKHFSTSVNGIAGKNLITAQHPNYPIDKELIDFETILRTPIFDFNSFPTIDKLPALNGVRNSYFCGSYFGYGLHEDAITSAINVAGQLGVEF